MPSPRVADPGLKSTTSVTSRLAWANRAAAGIFLAPVALFGADLRLERGRAALARASTLDSSAYASRSHPARFCGYRKLQSYVVPGTGRYVIEAAGAQGGPGGGPGGKGARLQGVFELNAGDVLQLIVGLRAAPASRRTSQPAVAAAARLYGKAPRWDRCPPSRCWRRAVAGVAAGVRAWSRSMPGAARCRVAGMATAAPPMLWTFTSAAGRHRLAELRREWFGAVVLRRRHPLEWRRRRGFLRQYRRRGRFWRRRRRGFSWHGAGGGGGFSGGGGGTQIGPSAGGGGSDNGGRQQINTGGVQEGHGFVSIMAATSIMRLRAPTGDGAGDLPEVGSLREYSRYSAV